MTKMYVHVTCMYIHVRVYNFIVYVIITIIIIIMTRLYVATCTYNTRSLVHVYNFTVYNTYMYMYVATIL